MHNVEDFDEDPGENEVPDIEDGEEDLEIMEDEGPEEGDEDDEAVKETEAADEAGKDAIAAKTEQISEATKKAVLAAMHTEEEKPSSPKLPSSAEALSQIPENAQPLISRIFRENQKSLHAYFAKMAELYNTGAERITKFAESAARLDGRSLGRTAKNFSDRDPVQLAKSLGFTALNHDASRAKLLASMKEIQSVYQACLALFGEEKTASVSGNLIIHSAAPMTIVEALIIFTKIIKKGKTSKVEKELEGILKMSSAAAPIKRITAKDLEKDGPFHWNNYKDNKKKKGRPAPRFAGPKTRALQRGILAAAEKGEDGFQNSAGFRVLLESTSAQISNILGDMQRAGKILAVRQKGRFHYFTPERVETNAAKPTAVKKKG